MRRRKEGQREKGRRGEKEMKCARLEARNERVEGKEGQRGRRGENKTS